jgi:mono/diheme cytochrome c family protein
MMVRTLAQAALAIVAATALHGCAGHGEDVELATYMGELHRFSQKLGYAIEGRNGPLAGFYVHEVEEVIEQLARVKEHDGLPIGQMTQTMAVPLIEPLDRAIQVGDWPAATGHYLGLIQSCNTCHIATQHAFIEILPASGPAPFNQRFTAD